MIRLFLCGDVMTGRGVDQILPHPSDPILHEPYVSDAREYVALAEAASGPLRETVDFSYVWGDVLEELERQKPDVRLVNLETSVTRCDAYWSGKGIHYRMHPENVPCITAARVDCCALANNHVLDWGYEGLLETLGALSASGVRTAGAGRNLDEARAPAVMDVGDGSALVFACGTESSGIPARWAASEADPGIDLLPDLSPETILRIRDQVLAHKRTNDLAILSIHWGENWGYRISPRETAFAHRLIDEAGIDLIHGHSSHHVKGIEVYRGKLILYGCGDFLDDYEGIRGYESYRDDLGLMYLPRLDPASGRLAHMDMVPTRVRQLSVHRARGDDARWLHAVLNREGERFGTRARWNDDGTLSLEWS